MGAVADWRIRSTACPFSKGFASSMTKHNAYSTMEAELISRPAGLQHPQPAHHGARRSRLPHAADATRRRLSTDPCRPLMSGCT